ncbi:uncharacterized protein LOC121546179 [Coregonus clupeaformis]|uniref:uncharacterized protein LOC121546179 n=1 Tax=Coregonus clupeaformis TaxID=59861 RepID=UPI001BE04DDA|nr:uncharacterized protein LOC121546179 [Coregonus clupeaformis]
MIRIRVVVVLFSTIYVTQCNNVQQHVQIQGVQIGDPVTLYCVFSKQVFNEGIMFWFKHVTGEIPQVVARMQKNQSRPDLHKEFNNSHLSVEKAQADGIYRLTIPKMEPTDQAIYYCVHRIDYEVNFINGTVLVLKGKNHQRSDYKTVVQRPMSDPFHPGDNVTLQCTVLSETCTGEHSVYWFRARSGESHPGVIYTLGNRRDECEKSPETPSPTKSCVYNLSNNNLSLSDAVTYYCAVATCGEILFGNGTKLDVKVGMDSNALVPVCIGLCGALILNAVLLFFIYSSQKETNDDTSLQIFDGIHNADQLGQQVQILAYKKGDWLQYTAVTFTDKTTGTRRKK